MNAWFPPNTILRFSQQSVFGGRFTSIWWSAGDLRPAAPSGSARSAELHERALPAGVRRCDPTAERLLGEAPSQCCVYAASPLPVRPRRYHQTCL